LSAVSAEWLLFGHLAGAFVFVSGALAAGALRLAALRARSARDVALLLRAVRPLVPLIGGGFLFTIGFGFALVDRQGIDLGSTWLVLTFALLGWIVVVGAVAGRQDRRTRELAERIAAGESGDADELARRLRSLPNLLLNGTLLAATAAIVALMVWKP
jgi:uncharacterized membrane protein